MTPVPHGPSVTEVAAGAPPVPAPVPFGVAVERLSDDAVAGVLVDLFGHARRCSVLDARAPGEPQWVLAELGDGRITGSCPQRHWRLSCADPATADLSAPPLAGDGSDAWRLLEAVVFSPSAQVRVAEGAEAAWLASDGDDTGELPAWLRPRDRSFLLAGWRAGPGYSRHLDGDIPFSIGQELSGTVACHPIAWRDFDVRGEPTPPGGRRRRAPSGEGAWISVREYWAEDPTTGAVGVAFHRLTGYHAGPKPTPPLGLDELDDVDKETP